MDVVVIFIKWLEISQNQKLDSLQEITNTWGLIIHFSKIQLVPASSEKR